MHLLGQEYRAFKLLDRRNYEKLMDVLDKEIRKDSLSPGAFYIKSLYFSDNLSPAFNIDSAYQYIQRAESQFNSLDVKSRDKLEKDGIDTSRIRQQNTRVISMAFDYAKSENTVQAYNDFISRYPQAAQVNDAITLRDKIAFDKATQTNTYEAYLDFVKTYPEARQTPEAQKRYDLLIYREFTKDGKLESYEKFVRDFPASAHRDEAINNIFELSTADNYPESYVEFIKNYSHSDLATLAAGYLYFTAEDTSWFLHQPEKNYSFIDSMRNLIALDTTEIIPVYESGQYGFMDQNGKMIIRPQFTNIDPSYLCGNIKDNFLTVWKDSSKFIIGRNGKMIFKKNFYSVEDLGYGLLRLSLGTKFGIIHQSGHLVLPFEFREVDLVGNHFIKAKKEQEWALYTLTGRRITDDIFDDVREEGDFILFEKSGKIALATVPEIVNVFNDSTLNLSYVYDDAVLIDKDHILCTRGKDDCILNGKLDFIIPPAPQHIYSYHDGWIVNRDTIYELYDNNYLNISGSGIKDISYKGDWMTGQINNKWILYYKFSPVPDEFVFDSVALIDEDYVWIKNGNAPKLILDNFSKIALKNYSGFSVMPKAQISPDEKFPAFLLLNRKNLEKDILSPEGKILFSGKYDNIKSLGYNYFLISKNNKYGLLDANGKQVLKPLYNGIADYHDGFVVTFNNGKFGIANPDKKIEIEPRFSASPEPMENDYFIVKNGDNIGIMNDKGEIIIDTLGNQIKMWNDTSFIIHSDDFWSIRSINSGKIFYPDLLNVKKIIDRPDSKFYLTENHGGFGILGSTSGPLINMTFTDILNLGSARHPVYFAEKYIPEAEFYIVIYYSAEGKVIRKQVFTSTEYNKIYCR